MTDMSRRAQLLEKTSRVVLDDGMVPRRTEVGDSRHKAEKHDQGTSGSTCSDLFAWTVKGRGASGSDVQLERPNFYCQRQAVSKLQREA